ncbi:DNA-binding protein [Nocardiopsis changdeensis]|uniref:DNA-binding protein n=1 Tax=Nocardiopsis changdeensis TaxID=2831969 RepID=A0ABX8BPA2_9ACTN|nr:MULTISPECIES: DNA-binding protein [Nocardiopsis]QUX23986.1 DNA-binding protein [Nocardiopsis changdeensis]QYX39931.1 DNA-binding protein [Nocardiopsis sp. MT53]
MAPYPNPCRSGGHRSSPQGEDDRDPAARTRAATARLIALDTRTGARHLVPAAASAAAAARRAVRVGSGAGDEVRAGARSWIGARSGTGAGTAPGPGPDFDPGHGPEPGPRTGSGSGADRDLLAAVAEAHQVAGWIAYDAEHQHLSRRMSLEALRLARAAGDRSMEHFALAQLAMQDVHVHRPAEAADICDAVTPQTRGSVRTLFTLRAARAAGQLGERMRALDLIRLTHSRHLDGPRDGDPAWSWWVNEAEIAWHHAMIHADTGDRAGAVERFAAATDRPGYARAVFVAHASLLWALARARAWSEAEEVLVQEVLPRLGEVASTRVERMLAEAARRLDGATRRPSLRDTAHGLAASLREVALRENPLRENPRREDSRCAPEGKAPNTPSS